jgi:hypothetical protein
VSILIWAGGHMTVYGSSTKLTWEPAVGYGFNADTGIGRYHVRDIGLSGFAANYQPPQGRVRLPNDSQRLGNFDTMANANEQHYAVRSTATEPIGDVRRA